jgi:addiction module HigA family antidote
MISNEHYPIHPGEILRKEFLEPAGMTTQELAQEISYSPDLLEKVIQGMNPMTLELSQFLSRKFDWPAEVWMRLQHNFEEQKAA